MNSVWTESEKRPNFEKLNEDKRTDVLIIGGGITGILCGFLLKQAGIDYIIAEAKEICSGITKNTTAKITSQHGLIYDKMIKRFGTEYTSLYYELQEKALEKYRDLAHTVKCDFEERDSYVYSLKNRQKIENEVNALNKIGCSASLCDILPLPFTTVGAVKVPNQAQFNPLKFVYGIAEGLNIYENTKVIELRPDGAVTNNGIIKAKKIIVATHFPFINKHGSYFLKMYQHRSYVLALNNTPDVNGMYVDEDEKGMSFRGYNGLLLLGGGGHRTGKKGRNWQELKAFANKYYKDSREEYRWATQDCMTLDSISYIGQYSSRTPNLYVATGYNKWGMTSAMAAAMILCDLVQEKDNKYAPVFSPSRSIIRPQLAVNTVEAVTNLLTPTVPRCPHMGCALKYNKQEHSWDCSCHGSRFTESGEVIDNPATDDKRM